MEDQEIKSPGTVSDTEMLKTIMDVRRMLLSDTMSSLPMWARLGYFCNAVNSAKEQEASIDWDFINELIFKDMLPEDFNCFTRFESSEQLFDAALRARDASIFDNLPWHKQVCKDCGKEFTLSLSEIHYYKEHGLVVPKRCEDCRHKRNPRPGQNKPTVPQKGIVRSEAALQSEAEMGSSTMREALKKAGLI